MSRRLEYNEETLDIRDLYVILSNSWEARIKWFNIGLGLNLEVGDLKAISQTNRDNVDDCFRDMLEKWLRTSLRPTQSNLITVLRERTVGFNQLAEELESKSFERDRVIHRLRMASTRYTKNGPPVPSLVKYKSDSVIIKIGAPMLITILLFTVFSIYYYNRISPENCFATGSGLEVAVVGERANAVLHIVDTSGKGYNIQKEIVVCELVSGPRKKKVYCNVKKVMENQYEVNYQPTSRGRHQLHIKVEGKHIKGSPFNVTVIRQLGGPKGTIEGDFESITFESVGQRLVAGEKGSISVFDSSLNKERSFGSFGSGSGEFDTPCALAMESAIFLLVADCTNNHIHIFNIFSGRHITQSGETGKGFGEFDRKSIAIHPKNGMVYIADYNKNRIQVLHPNLTFHKIVGFNYDRTLIINPESIAFDSTGNMYVADYPFIRVFTAEGKFLKYLGTVGEGEGEIKNPSAITIDNNDVVYVGEWTNGRVSLFTTEGKFLTSIDSKEMPISERISPIAITVDNKGIVYVVDGKSKDIKVY